MPEEPQPRDERDNPEQNGYQSRIRQRKESRTQSTGWKEPFERTGLISPVGFQQECPSTPSQTDQAFSDTDDTEQFPAPNFEDNKAYQDLS